MAGKQGIGRGGNVTTRFPKVSGTAQASAGKKTGNAAPAPRKAPAKGKRGNARKG